MNGIISMIYNIIYENRVENSFITILAVILIIINNYTGFARIVVNNIHVKFILPTKAQ